MDTKLMDDITKLTDDYYSLVSKDHHKDKDCHWYINTVWSYGQLPYYRVEHFGYCSPDYSEKFDTYDSALEFLKGILEKEVSETIKFVEE